MNTLKWIYKVIRSILFTAVVAMVVIFVFLYAALSIPPVQEMIRDRLVKELSIFLGSKVKVRNLTIHPLNEVIIEDAVFFDLNNKECLNVKRLGAGINIWRLIFSGDIEITYVELIDFKADIYQKDKDQPLNIDFIIKAFEPKDKNKPPTLFDLKIHNIVLRGGKASFSKLWLPKGKVGVFNSNYITLDDLNADITIPRLSNDDTQIDLRKLSFSESSGLQVREIGGLIKINPDCISIANLIVRLPESIIKTRNLVLPMGLLKNFDYSDDSINVTLYDSKITPADLAAFYPPLASFDSPIPIQLSVVGNKKFITVNSLDIDTGNGFSLKLKGFAKDLFNQQKMEVDIENLDLDVMPEFVNRISSLFPELSANRLMANILNSVGKVEMTMSGRYYESSREITTSIVISTGIGNFSIDGNLALKDDFINTILNIDAPGINISEIIPQSPVGFVKDATVKLAGDFNLKDIIRSSGIVDFNIGEINLLNRTLTSIRGSASKQENYYDLDLAINDNNLNGKINASAEIAGENSKWDLEAEINDFDTYNSFLSDSASEGFELKGSISAHGRGLSFSNIMGDIRLSDFYLNKWNGKSLHISDLSLHVENHEDSFNQIELNSDIVDFLLTGNYNLTGVPAMIKRTLGEVCPSIFNQYPVETNCGAGNFELSVKDAMPLIEFFNIPVVPLTELTVNGRFDSARDMIEFSSDIPYIQQGTNTLITNSYIKADIFGKEGLASVSAGTVFPTKKGLLKIDLQMKGDKGKYDICLDLNKGRDVAFFGSILLNLSLEKDPFSGQVYFNAEWLPSQLFLNDTSWDIEEAEMVYDNEGIRVNNFSIRHGDQFIIINGKSSKGGDGELNLNIADINVDYIFETLNIPHVTFGGTATGRVIAKSVFSEDPQIYTEDFVIKNMSYNGALLGDGDIFSRLDMPQKKIAIGANIKEGGHQVAAVDGGVWFTRDSLSFSFDADKVNVGIIKPFMQAFSSDIKGKASGNALLYGTFSDIDMEGALVADNVEILIDYINTRYTANDTVFMSPGKISLPDFKVRDQFGNTANLNGEVTHRFFHDPAFTFTFSDMDNLLVYNTNAKINPLWYGIIYASGAGEITGKPGIVSIKADVQTDKGSDFTFVLSDQQEAVKSHFLTFSDKKKETKEAEEARKAAAAADTIPDFLKKFHKKQDNNPGDVSQPDIFTMDIRASVTPDIRFNLIMDPVQGDKITAYGDGAMNITYTSLTDEMRLFGKYILEKGTYNFSLQDIILKDFTIKPGSSIAFTGDPYTGILDMTAAYRVNTNLTELDKSFANDRELNRTSVPVEALLKVSGPLTAPNIGFDIELPTVTEETAQKVRSIISTDDMMSRQVIYLVALNKFYSPEYMATTNSGGEWASIATSTFSSQLQNMIGQLTDKFTLAPSIKSDKGDFSDLEVDIALSSQLFNNRLLINGNLGYRDPSNSSTTFIGDFDLEYLLNNKGTWRLKAYNHFNDQNYYLKSSLTTQGIGIVWRKDFGLPRKKEKDEKNKTVETPSQ